MGLTKEKLQELIVLSRKWEKEYIGFLTASAVEFQQKSGLFREKLAGLISAADAKKNGKNLLKKIEKSALKIEKCFLKIRNGKGFSKSKDLIDTILREIS